MFNTAYAHNRSILIIGDSLSAGYGIDTQYGWPTLLQDKLENMQCDYSVINNSVDGDTTSNGLTRIGSALEDYQPDVVIIALGGNDGLRAINPVATKHNLAHMVQKTRETGARVLLVGVRLPPNYGQAYISRYRQVYFEIADECEVPLVPKVLENVGGVDGLIQADGIHPNEIAQPIILGNVWSELGPILGC